MLSAISTSLGKLPIILTLAIEREIRLKDPIWNSISVALENACK